MCSFRARTKPALVLFLMAASTLCGGAAFAQAHKSTPAGSAQKLEGAAAQLSAIVASGRLADLRWPNFSNYRSQVTSFYRPFTYEPAWVRDGQPTEQALALVEILQDADQEGLRAEDYDGSRWADRLAALRGRHGDAEEARFDAALTICVMRYLSDLHVGRINPQHLGFEFDGSQKKLDLAEFVRERLVNGSNLRAEMAAVAPPFQAISDCETHCGITSKWKRVRMQRKSMTRDDCLRGTAIPTSQT